MTLKKNKVLRLLILTVLAIIISTSCGGNNMGTEKAFANFSKLIEKEDFDDLSLTIYYISPEILTRAPLSVDDLINYSIVKKIVISGKDVENQIDLFKQISKSDFIPVKKTSRIDARFCYVFESVKDGKLFDVAMWGDDYSVFINGFEVKENDIFYDVIIPFLSDDAKIDLAAYLGSE